MNRSTYSWWSVTGADCYCNTKYILDIVFLMKQKSPIKSSQSIKIVRSNLIQVQTKGKDKLCNTCRNIFIYLFIRNDKERGSFIQKLFRENSLDIKISFKMTGSVGFLVTDCIAFMVV